MASRRSLSSLLNPFRQLFRKTRRSGRPTLAVSREQIERLVGQTVGELALYEQALRHRSILRGEPESHLRSNERLEFLGDAVLGFVIAEHLYHHFPEKNEGFLTRMRAKLVNGQVLARYARRVHLGDVLLLSDNMAQGGGRQNQTILADAFEAVIGALYLDLGMTAARAFIERAILHHIDLEDLAERRDNFKSLLLEHAQAQGWAQPEYRVIAEEGPSHDRTFTVEVHLQGACYGVGRAGSKKKAEQEAAEMALDRLQENADPAP